MSDMVDNVICSDGSWLLVGETGSSSCIGGHMINLGPPRPFERLSCDDAAATSLSCVIISAHSRCLKDHI